MPKYVRGKNGKFAGSIGDGKTSLPTNQNNLTRPPTHLIASEDPAANTAADLGALYQRYGTSVKPDTAQEPVENDKTPVGYNAPMLVTHTALHGVYTEYLANVEQLHLDDLDDMTGPYNWAALIDDIKTNGIREPIEIGVDENGDQYIINGCHRAVIAVQLNLKDVPVIYRRD